VTEPQPSSSEFHHIVTALVENKAGVLARIAGLFARRGFNIYSLAVAPTHDERFSRITIVVDLESSSLSQVINQLDKLINVVSIQELHPTRATQRELLLATVKAPDAQRAQVVQTVGVFGGRVLDADGDLMTVELSGEPETLDAFEKLLVPFGIVDLQRTGRIALPRLA
jgi:acetolactate synthase-1/3 small subunit